MSNLDSYLPTLTIHVLWMQEDPKSNSAYLNGHLNQIADSLYANFTRSTDNPLDRGMGIPVFFHTQQPPTPSILENSRHTIIVALIDDKMVIDNAWGEGLSILIKSINNSSYQHRFYPVSFSSNAFNINTDVSMTNFIRLHDITNEEQARQLSRVLTHELCRLLLDKNKAPSKPAPTELKLSPAPVTLFLSHAKADGEDLTKTLRDHVTTTSAVKSFFDSHDIAAGFDFRNELEGNIEQSVLVVMQTDHFASRTWCRREVLWAKSKGCPMIVINAVQKREMRSFPYMGNVPTIRVNGKNPDWCNEVIELALNEMLRHSWFRENLADLTQVELLPKNIEASPYPPEVLTLLTRQHTDHPSRLIYPDPPLGAEERILLSLAASDLTITTPTSSYNINDNGDNEQSLEGLQVGVSISNSPNLAEYDMGQAHLQDAMLEIARYLLVQGANLAYGGDLRPGGFTEQLLELVWAYTNQKKEDDLILTFEKRTDITSRRLANYVGWPIYLSYSDDTLAKNHLKGVFKYIDIPEELGLDETQKEVFVPPVTPEHRYWWFSNLTAMREQMANDIDARIVLGGQVRGYAGGIPGLVEEVLLGLRLSKPIFLLGGMGGCARVIIDAIEGKTPEQLTVEYQSKTEGYADFLEYIEQQPNAIKIDYPAMINELQDTGVSGLNNGLNNEENQILFNTPHISVMVSLLLKGLSNI